MIHIKPARYLALLALGGHKLEDECAIVHHETKRSCSHPSWGRENRCQRVVKPPNEKVKKRLDDWMIGFNWFQTILK